MTLTPAQTLGMILAVAAGTQLTRWLPFWLFPEKKAPPPVVMYLGKVLPPAMMGLLVIYCLKGVTWLSAPHGAPELIAIAVVTASTGGGAMCCCPSPVARRCTWCWCRWCSCKTRTGAGFAAFSESLAASLGLG